jgi:hypothetical protein
LLTSSEGWSTVQDDVAIWYRGANYQLGRGQHGYGIWSVAGSPDYPLEHWPETPQGWAAAWARFTAVEHPAAIVHLSQPVAPVARSNRAVIAAALLGAGVVCGIAGLFPDYQFRASLASQPANLVPHVIYLAAWLASGGMILAGGGWRRAGALLGLGTSAVAFGFFFADLGAAIAGEPSAMGAGLVLGLIGWLASAAGAAIAAWPPGLAGAPNWQLARGGRAAVTVAVSALLAIGTAITFAPSWDSYTLRTPSQLVGTQTAGNIFSDPGAVIIGNVAVMVALVLVAIAAALWRPARLGAALLAGAIIPMAAQAISALIQIGERVSPTQFGISPGRAAQVGLTITSGLTPVFWVYVVLVIGLAGVCAWLLVPARPQRPAAVPVAPVPAASIPWQPQ